MSEVLQDIQHFLDQDDEQFNIYSIHNHSHQSLNPTPNPVVNNTSGFYYQQIEGLTYGYYNDERLSTLYDENSTPNSETDCQSQANNLDIIIEETINFDDQTPQNTPTPNEGVKLNNNQSQQKEEVVIVDFENPDYTLYTNDQNVDPQNVQNQDYDQSPDPSTQDEQIIVDQEEDFYQHQGNLQPENKVEGKSEPKQKKSVQKSNGEKYKRSTKIVQQYNSELRTAQINTLTYYNLQILCKRSQILKQGLKRQGSTVTKLLNQTELLDFRPKTIYDQAHNLRKAHLNGLNFELYGANQDINDIEIKQYWDDETALAINQVVLKKLVKPKFQVLQQLRMIFNEELNNKAEQKARDIFEYLQEQYIN